jgi:hypothetical protein
MNNDDGIDYFPRHDVTLILSRKNLMSFTEFDPKTIDFTRFFRLETVRDIGGADIVIFIDRGMRTYILKNKYGLTGEVASKR